MELGELSRNLPRRVSVTLRIPCSLTRRTWTTYVPWRPTKWGRLCAEAQKPEMTFSDLGHILVDLVDTLPTAFRKYLV